MAVEQMWRCTGCGKWSHARRRPTSHRRWVSGAEHTKPPAGATVVERVEPTYDHLNGFTSDGGWFVTCGPFERWLAQRTDGDLR